MILSLVWRLNVSRASRSVLMTQYCPSSRDYSPIILHEIRPSSLADRKHFDNIHSCPISFLVKLINSSYTVLFQFTFKIIFHHTLPVTRLLPLSDTVYKLLDKFSLPSCNLTFKIQQSYRAYYFYLGSNIILLILLILGLSRVYKINKIYKYYILWYINLQWKLLFILSFIRLLPTYIFFPPCISSIIFHRVLLRCDSET